MDVLIVCLPTVLAHEPTALVPATRPKRTLPAPGPISATQLVSLNLCPFLIINTFLIVVVAPAVAIAFALASAQQAASCLSRLVRRAAFKQQ